MARHLPPRVIPDVPASPVPAGPPATRDRLRLQPASEGGRRRGTGEHVPLVPAARELWLAVHLPGCVLESLRTGAVTSSRAAEPLEAGHGGAEPCDGAPVAVVDLARGGKVVCDVDARAAAAGVVPGMALNSALALEPALQLQSRDPRREQALLEAVARVACGFTPRVSIEPPDAVLLEVRGSLHLFGGARRLCEQLRARLQSHGVVPRLALAPAPLASLWFVRAGEELLLRRPDSLPARLAPLPLACTRWPARTLQSLATMGVRTVGECLRLPRDGFVRRFGPRLRLELDRATGRVPDPRAAFLAAGRYVASLDLEPELEEAERLQRSLAPLAGELCTFLDARGAAIESLELQLRHREAAATRLCLRFAGPVSDATRIMDLLRERLAGTPLPGPVRSVRLRSGPLVEAQVAADDLFGGDCRRAAAAPQLVERLRARLGAGAVHGLGLVAEHRPEAAQGKGGEGEEGEKKGDVSLFQKGDVSLFPSSLPVLRAKSMEKGKRPLFEKGKRPLFFPLLPLPPLFPARPAWLLAEPQLLGHDTPPCYEGPLDIEEGPERIESGWWDGHDVRRDYYVARNPGGVRLWIFRERGAAGGWFLHGVFG